MRSHSESHFTQHIKLQMEFCLDFFFYREWILITISDTSDTMSGTLFTLCMAQSRKDNVINFKVKFKLSRRKNVLLHT